MQRYNINTFLYSPFSLHHNKAVYGRKLTLRGVGGITACPSGGVCVLDPAIADLGVIGTPPSGGLGVRPMRTVFTSLGVPGPASLTIEVLNATWRGV